MKQVCQLEGCSAPNNGVWHRNDDNGTRHDFCSAAHRSEWERRRQERADNQIPFKERLERQITGGK